jgi:hypothetical protein
LYTQHLTTCMISIGLWLNYEYLENYL